MQYFWLIPVISFIAFIITSLVGNKILKQAWIFPVVAIILGLGIYCFGLTEYLQSRFDLEHCVRSSVTGMVGCNYSVGWFSAGVTGKETVDSFLGFTVDPLSLSVAGLAIFVALMVQIYSIGYMKDDPRFGWYYSVQALFISSMILLALSDNFLLLYVSWELVGLCSYLLIGFWYEKPDAKEAAKKAFTVTRLGDVGLLIGILLIWIEVGSFNMSDLFSYVASGQMESWVIFSISGLLFLGAMGKSAQFPFHVWLPDAMEGPTPVSALIHAATMVAAGVYLVARTYPLFVESEAMMLIVSIIGLITAIGAALICCVSIDLKRALAYSTISHLGLMMLSLGAFGYTAAILHLLAHGFSKALLFLGSGNIMHSIDDLDINRMGGLKSVLPGTTILFCIGALSLAGIPLLSGFWSKDEVIVSIVHNRNILFAISSMILVFLSGFYMIRLIIIPFFGTQNRDYSNAHKLPMVMLIPMGVLAVFVVLFGWVALYMPGLPSSFGTFLFYSHPKNFHLEPDIASITLVVTLLSFGAGYLFYVKRISIFQTFKTRMKFLITIIENKYYFDELYQILVDKIVLPIASLVALFDRVLVNDIGINGPGHITRSIGSMIRYHVTGRIYVYLGLMTSGMIILGILWLWIVRL